MLVTALSMIAAADIDMFSSHHDLRTAFRPNYNALQYSMRDHRSGLAMQNPKELMWEPY